MPIVEVRYLFNNGDVVLKPFNFLVSVMRRIICSGKLFE